MVTWDEVQMLSVAGGTLIPFYDAFVIDKPPRGDNKHLSSLS